jgi:hypothetical protein
MLEPNRVLKPMQAVLMAFAIVAYSASAQAQSSGVLKITSFPSGAKVVVDHVDTGKVTPMSVSLSVGDHEVVVSIPNSGWNPDSRVVTVVSGNNDLSVTLLPFLTVGPPGPPGPAGPAGPPGADAHRDGAACTTPTAQPGSIQITQSKDGVQILRCRVGTGRFIDNGDGTITDTQTGLMWETKSGCPNVRCVDDRYTWDDAMGNWLDWLNGRLISSASDGGFAGYSDWRLPTLAELRTVDTRSGSPTIDPIFGSTAAAFYWSASTGATGELGVGVIFNLNGGVFFDRTTAFHHVRAVRAARD